MWSFVVIVSEVMCVLKAEHWDLQGWLLFDRYLTWYLLFAKGQMIGIRGLKIINSNLTIRVDFTPQGQNLQNFARDICTFFVMLGYKIT